MDQYRVTNFVIPLYAGLSLKTNAGELWGLERPYKSSDGVMRHGEQTPWLLRWNINNLPLICKGSLLDCGVYYVGVPSQRNSWSAHECTTSYATNGESQLFKRSIWPWCAWTTVKLQWGWYLAPSYKQTAESLKHGSGASWIGNGIA